MPSPSIRPHDLFYRKDIFDKYAAFQAERLRLNSGTRDFTRSGTEVAKWIEANVPDEEVKYGSGFMAQNLCTLRILQCDGRVWGGLLL